MKCNAERPIDCTCRDSNGDLIYDDYGNKKPAGTKLRFARKDYLFSKSPYGDGIMIDIDGIKVLLPHYLIIELMKN